MGCKLKEFREKRGMSISELSRRSGVSRNTIYRLEEASDDAGTSTKTLLKIADALEATIDQIFFADSV